MQQGLEGPLDLCPLTRSVLWMGQTHKHMHTLQTHNRAKSYQSTCRYFQLFLMVERAEGLVSVMCFPQRAFGYHTDNSCCFFSVTLHVAAPNPQAAFFYLQVQSSLCPLVLSSMQFYSVSSPLISAYCYPSPHINTPSPAFCMADNHQPLSVI